MLLVAQCPLQGATVVLVIEAGGNVMVGGSAPETATG
jgi:hypothetical protein